MTIEEIKTHIITPALYDFRDSDRCCPRCNDGTRIGKRFRTYEDPETGRVYNQGCYWSCDRYPNDTDHYQLSPGGGDKCAKPRETNGLAVPTPRPPNVGPSVVRRDRATGKLTKVR